MSKVKQLYADIQRYKELKKLLMGNESFVEIEDTDDWKEFNSLCIKLTPYFQMISKQQ